MTTDIAADRSMLAIIADDLAAGIDRLDLNDARRVLGIAGRALDELEQARAEADRWRKGGFDGIDRMADLLGRAESERDAAMRDRDVLEQRNAMVRDLRAQLATVEAEAASMRSIAVDAIAAFRATMEELRTSLADAERNLLVALTPMEQERDSLRSWRARWAPVVEAAKAWHEAEHTGDANCAAGDCDSCPARPAEAALQVAICAAMEGDHDC